MPWSREKRTIAYCMLVTALAAAIYLPFLGLHPMSGDEPQYALCVDDILARGDWLSPTPYPPEPYFQKPPLYMWLTASTARFFDRDSAVKYRVWSALFGVAAIGATALLGALVVNPEVGLVGAMLMLVNDDWARNHGALTGTFDSGLTLACTICFLLYWRWTRRRAREWIWCIIGVVCGLASLMKPAFGVLPLVLLAAHALLIDGKRDRTSKAIGLVSAVVIAFATSAWWYIIQYHRFGQRYLDEVFRRNIVSRISEGLSPHHVKSSIYYVTRISQSSLAYGLAFAGLAYVLIVAIRSRGRRRAAYGYLALLGWGWLGMFSVSASKYLHYAYPVFPVIGISMAAMLIDAGQWLRRRSQTPAWMPMATYFLVPALIVLDTARLGQGMASDARRFYAPWAVYQTFHSAIAAGRCRIVLYRFPQRLTAWQGREALDLEAKDAFYLQHIRADRADTPAELAAMMDRPTALILSRFNDLPALQRQFHLDQRSDDRFGYDNDKVLMYAVDFGQMLRPHAQVGQTSPDGSVRANQSSEGEVTVHLRPAIRCDGVLSITGHAMGHESERVKYSVTIGPRQQPQVTARVGGGVQIFGAEIGEDNWARGDSDTIVTVRLKEPGRLKVEDVQLSLDPRLTTHRQDADH